MTKLPKYRLFVMILCFIAFFGFSQTTISVSMSFLDTTRTVNLSLATIFEDLENPINNLSLEQSDLSDMVGDGDIMVDVRGRVILSVVAYLITFVLILAIYILTVMGKLNKTRIVMLALASSLVILSGFVILTVPGIIADSLMDRIGFLALFIDLTELLSISLGFGYWIILSTSVAMLLIEIYTVIKERRNPYDDGTLLLHHKRAKKSAN